MTQEDLLALEKKSIQIYSSSTIRGIAMLVGVALMVGGLFLGIGLTAAGIAVPQSGIFGAVAVLLGVLLYQAMRFLATRPDMGHIEFWKAFLSSAPTEDGQDWQFTIPDDQLDPYGMPASQRFVATAQGRIQTIPVDIHASYRMLGTQESQGSHSVIEYQPADRSRSDWVQTNPGGETISRVGSQSYTYLARQLQFEIVIRWKGPIPPSNNPPSEDEIQELPPKMLEQGSEHTFLLPAFWSDDAERVPTRANLGAATATCLSRCHPPPA